MRILLALPNPPWDAPRILSALLVPLGFCEAGIFEIYGGNPMNLAKTCLAILAGALLGAAFITLVHPRTAKAQGGKTIWVTRALPNGEATVKGSTVVGFSCVAAGPGGYICMIASE